MMTITEIINEFIELRIDIHRKNIETLEHQTDAFETSLEQIKKDMDILRPKAYPKETTGSAQDIEAFQDLIAKRKQLNKELLSNQHKISNIGKIISALTYQQIISESITAQDKLVFVEPSEDSTFDVLVCDAQNTKHTTEMSKSELQHLITQSKFIVVYGRQEQDQLESEDFIKNNQYQFICIQHLLRPEMNFELQSLETILNYKKIPIEQGDSRLTKVAKLFINILGIIHNPLYGFSKHDVLTHTIDEINKTAKMLSETLDKNT